MTTQCDTFSEGDMAGAYEIQELIGAGGHSEVYRCVGPKGERVAMKCLRETVRGSEKLQERFVGEARVLRELDNPHIVRFLDYGVTPEGVPWLAMELIEGVLLRDYLHDRGGRLDIDTAFLFARQIARAAHHAHGHDVIHRDLKPENVMVVSTSLVKVFDFGIARLRGWGNKTTLPGERCGMPLYMAPEQIDGEETGAWTDVFAIGVILYECLAGRHPFDNKDGVPPPQAPAPPPGAARSAAPPATSAPPAPASPPPASTFEKSWF
jgi:serine/threonine-protein kinase